MLTVTAGTEGRLPHTSPHTEAFWNMPVLQTITWKYLKPQENGLKIQVPLHVTCVLDKLTAWSAPGKARALEPAAGNAVWAMKGLQKSRHHLQQLCFSNPSSSCCFFGTAAAFLWLFLSAKCWRALKCHTTIILNEAPVCVFRRPHLDMLRGANNTPQTCWDNTACAHNCECLQAYCQECLARVGKGKERWDTLFSGELTYVGVAALHLWLFWDPNFCLSRAQPKTYDPLYCCFPLSIRQALKKTFQDMSWKYFLMFEWKLSFKVIYSFGLLFF